MKVIATLFLLWSTLMSTPSLYDFQVVNLHKEKTTLAPYKGKVIARYAPSTAPEAIDNDIKKLLEKQ